MRSALANCSSSYQCTKWLFACKLQNLFFQRSVLIYFVIFENIASRYDRSCNDIRSDCQIGHFRITSGLFFEASLGAHPFICKSIFIHTQIKLIFMLMKIDLHMKRLAPRLALKKNLSEARGNSEMAYLELHQ